MKSYERFLNYITYPTMSDEESETVPSTKKQLALANALKDELIALGLENAEVDSFGYVYASLEKNTDKEVNSIGFIAHMDTSSEASDTDIKATVHKYEGGDITLNEEKNIVLFAKEYPYVENYKGQSIITSDGTTLIGADDKAGIAEIMTALERIIASGMKHGKISVAFTPDEEIGRGADHFDVQRFGADYAYTVDGGALGEVEYENFNAARADVTVHGVSIHPGTAKDKMKNASNIACRFNSLLPPDEVPERTEGYQGFHHLLSMDGEIELAHLYYILRDHDGELLEKKKEDFLRVCAALNAEYGEGTVEVKITDQYRNMKEMLLPCMFIIDRVTQAMNELGITPIITPIRGGTDGARLSYMGLPCPNLCTGGHNFHSRFEFISCEAMEKVTDLLVKITENVAKEERIPVK